MGKTWRVMLIGGAVLGALLVNAPVRAAAPVFVVNSSADTSNACTRSQCTFRAALAAANNAGSGVIQFNIPPGGAQTIEIGATTGVGLPEVTASNVSIDATTQPGAQAPSVRIDDPTSNSQMSGIVFDGNNDSVRGLVITRFHGYGVLIRSTSSGDVVAGDWIGTADGSTAAGVTVEGVEVEGPNNTIGGTTAADRNVISATTGGEGVHVSYANNTVITGNYIGTTADGMNRLPNAGAGITLYGASTNNRIGGTTTGERNVITGNGGQGVQVLGVAGNGTCTGKASYNT
ncbi:MAG: right-handed parallel beta-helix repeat-containing protein, partial [Candidatus Dormibacteria bacterium]